MRWDGRKYTYRECNGGKPHLTLMGVRKASLRKGHLGGDQEAGKEEVFQAVGGMDKGLRVKGSKLRELRRTAKSSACSFE